MSEVKEAVVAGADFKAVISAVSRFPSLGAFVNSEMVNLRVYRGRLWASTVGIAVSRAEVAAAGDLALCAVDERTLMPFASTVVQKPNVTITYDDKRVIFRTRGREITVPFIEGQDHQISKITTLTSHLKITSVVGDRLSWLSALAMTDFSRPDLNCVMVTGGKAMAANQKAMACIDCKINGHSGVTALPLPILKDLQKADVIQVGGENTILASGIGRYQMPTPVKAQQGFPTSLVLQAAKGTKKRLGVVAGDKLVHGFEELASCLGNVNRSEVVLTLTFGNDKMELKAENAGVTFRRNISVAVQTPGCLVLPLVEVINTVSLLRDKEVSMYRGAAGEGVLSFGDGWALYPSWKKA